MLKRTKTTKKINKLKENGAKNTAASVKSNFHNVISNNICAPRSNDTAIRIFTVNATNAAVYSPKQHVKGQYLPVILSTVIYV